MRETHSPLLETDVAYVINARCQDAETSLAPLTNNRRDSVMAKETIFPENLDDNAFRPLSAPDISGERFGALVANAYVGCTKQGAYWYCLCDCGAARVVRAPALRYGAITHCGDKSLHSPKHNADLIEQFFHSSTRKTDGGCWECTAVKNANEYGLINVNGKSGLAHRYSYRTFVGPIPDGMGILHSCDNPPCVNPDHLRPGTPMDNSRDKVERNRCQAILTRESVENIKTELSAPIGERPRQRDLAKKYGISQGNVSDILTEKIWSHVPWPLGYVPSRRKSPRKNK